MGDPHTAWLHFGRRRFEEQHSACCFLKTQQMQYWEQEMRGLNASNEAMVDELIVARQQAVFGVASTPGRECDHATLRNPTHYEPRSASTPSRLWTPKSSLLEKLHD